MRPLIVLAVSFALTACGSNYHPEYHPVTAVSYTQTVGSPAYVQPGGYVQQAQPGYVQSAQGPVVYAAPGQGGPVAEFPAPPQPPQPPAEFPW